MTEGTAGSRARGIIRIRAKELKGRIETYIRTCARLLSLAPGQVLGGVVQRNLQLEVRAGIRPLEAKIAQCQFRGRP